MVSESNAGDDVAKVMRFVGAIPGVLMGLSAFGWLTNPAGAAENLGMPLLDGIGRSSQVGDFSAFFLGTTVMIFVGVFTQRRTWMYAAALLLGGAAVMRSFAAVAHGAEFATTFIVIEVVMAAILIGAALTFPPEGETTA